MVELFDVGRLQAVFQLGMVEACVVELALVVYRVVQCHVELAVAVGLALAARHGIGVGQHLVGVHQQFAAAQPSGFVFAAMSQGDGLVVVARLDVDVAYLALLVEQVVVVHASAAGVVLGPTVGGDSLLVVLFRCADACLVVVDVVLPVVILLAAHVAFLHFIVAVGILHVAQSAEAHHDVWQQVGLCAGVAHPGGHLVSP